MRAPLASLVAAALLAPPSLAAAQAPTCAASADLPVVRALARGFNLPGWVSGETRRSPDLDLLARLNARGFTHIRLPVGVESLMEAFSDGATIARSFAALDDALDALLARGYVVSLDAHPGGRFARLYKESPPGGVRLLQLLWSDLADRYRARPADRLLFEVLNEPPVPPAVWNEHGPRLVAAIRRVAPAHTIVYGPADDQQIGALAALAPLTAPNIVYAVHFYAPMVFTHQGLDWSDDPLRDLAGVPFPADLADPRVATLARDLAGRGRDAAAELLRRQLQRPWDARRIDEMLAVAGRWAQRHARPVIVNEFGVLGWKAPPADRARWLTAVRQGAERHCLGWTHWDYADGFGFVRRDGAREVADEAILAALLGDGTER